MAFSHFTPFINKPIALSPRTAGPQRYTFSSWLSFHVLPSCLFPFYFSPPWSVPWLSWFQSQCDSNLLRLFEGNAEQSLKQTTKPWVALRVKSHKSKASWKVKWKRTRRRWTRRFIIAIYHCGFLSLHAFINKSIAFSPRTTRAGARNDIHSQVGILFIYFLHVRFHFIFHFLDLSFDLIWLHSQCDSNLLRLCEGNAEQSLQAHGEALNRIERETK